MRALDPTTSPYAQRVHRVIDHVRAHLDRDLSLAELAKLAHFSPYHFHRVFKATTGETLAAFTRRARLERAVYLMRAAPERELTSIAVEVGFRTPSDFSRVFRAHYGCAPSRWDRRSRLDGAPHLAAELAAATPEWVAPTVELREHPACRVVYIRVRDPWRGPTLAQGYAQLTTWLAGRGHDWRALTLLGMSWDSEMATPIERLAYDLGFVIAEPPALAPDDAFGIHALPAVRAAELRCTSLRDTALAWDHLYCSWLPASAWEPADLPAIKRFRVTPQTIDADAWQVDCSIALRPRSA